MRFESQSTFPAGSSEHWTLPEISNHDEPTGIASHNLLLGQAAPEDGKEGSDNRS
jgi:hypothetical protein